MNENSQENNLFEIASSQGGYFTSIQASSAGYNPKNHTYHVKTGNWIKEWRGIYRLARFSLQDDSQYSLWGVWSMNRKGIPQGTYSHETALSIYELSDLQPDKIHMSVPQGYRRHSKIPNVIQLHFINFDYEDCERKNGYLVTKPFKTIIDLINGRAISPEYIKQAVSQALERGLITRRQYRSLKEHKRIGKHLIHIMGDET